MFLALTYKVFKDINVKLSVDITMLFDFDNKMSSNNIENVNLKLSVVYSEYYSFGPCVLWEFEVQSN